MNISDWIQMAVGIVLFMTLWAVLWYAYETKKMRHEMLESRFASFQPIIVMGRWPASLEESEQEVAVVLGATIKYRTWPPDRKVVREETVIYNRAWVYNLGPGVALNVRFLLETPSRKNTTATRSGPELKALGPDEVYELLLGEFGDRMTGRCDLTAEYDDVFGRRWCSGLELVYDSQRNCYTVIKLFYERLS